MGFRFSLATVLRIREIAEEREERLLGEILQQITRTRQRIAELAAEHASLVQRRESEMQRQVSAAELHILYGQLHAIEAMQDGAQGELSKLETLRVQQMKAYEAAHQARELLAGMRTEQLEAYRREQTRQEQNTMDDNFVARRAMR